MRAAVRAERARRGQAPRSASCRTVKRVVKVVAFVASTPGLHRPARVANGASRAVRRGVRRRRAARPLARSASRCCRSTRRSRSSSSSRSLSAWTRRRRLPAAPRRARPRVRRRQPRRRSSRGTPRRSCCCGTATAAGRLEVYLLRRQSAMAFAGRHVRVPRRRRRPARLRRRRSAGPARRRPSGPALLGMRRGDRRGRWCAPRCARRSRSPACCWPGPTEDAVVADTTGDDWEADRRRAGGARAVVHRRSSTRRGLRAAHRPARLWGAWLTPVFEPRRYRHLVLRRRAARPASAPATCRPSPTRWPGCRSREAIGAVDARRDADAAADVPAPASRSADARDRRRADAGRGRDRGCSRRRAGGGRRRGGRLPVDPRPPGRLGEDVAARMRG